MKKPLFVTIPHSGEQVPENCRWLQGLAEEVLMCDVDRFVDRLYEPILQKLTIPLVKTQWHRYAADLNRVPEDIDEDSVAGHANPSGSNNRGFHWVITTQNFNLMKSPMPPSLHEELVKEIYEPFHAAVRNQYQTMKNTGAKNVYHLDLHSMPSLGTLQHRDPGERRADIVVSDCKGKSCEEGFVDLVVAAFARAGFKVRYNWPYFGGRLSELYGVPKSGQHAIQVEVSRSLYMDEETKKFKPEEARNLQAKLEVALNYINEKL